MKDSSFAGHLFYPKQREKERIEKDIVNFGQEETEFETELGLMGELSFGGSEGSRAEGEFEVDFKKVGLLVEHFGHFKKVENENGLNSGIFRRGSIQ